MRNLLESRRGSAAIVAAIVLVFFALRIALLVVRDPFFDELFTLWIAQKPPGGILEALRHDSGPPLFYFLVRALALRSVGAIRVLSLVASTATLGIVLSARSFGKARLLAAAFLAVYPPAVLFAVDARAYALCALFITAGLAALCSERPFTAAIAFVAAAYSHYYGALFFPLLLMPVGREAAGSVVRKLIAFATAAVLFAPGLWLALHQPRQAIRWLSESRWSWTKNLSFAGDYAHGLFVPAPPWLVAIAGVLLLVAVVAPLVRVAQTLLSVPRRSTDKSVCATSELSGTAFWAAAILVPLILAVLAGAYFPMRFESVIAVPLTLWLAVSFESWSGAARRALVAALMVIGLVTSYGGIVDHAQRPIDAYRAAALWTASHVRASDTVVASGYCYLEAATWVRAHLIALPPEQAIHPGWRAVPTAGTRSPAGAFVWIGERAAPELSILRKTRSVEPLYVNDQALVAAVR
jgi:hypothetical protein